MADADLLALAVRVEGLSEIERTVAKALCGNAWTGDQITPGLALMSSLELMHIDVLKDKFGAVRRFKAKPTPLGLAFKEALDNSDFTPIRARHSLNQSKESGE